MGTKNNNYFDLENLDYYLGTLGFLYPINEIQMARFDDLFKDFNFKLGDTQIDCLSIIEGRRRQEEVHRLDNVSEEDIAQLRMVARKGISDLPQDILDKIYGKHRKKPGDPE